MVQLPQLDRDVIELNRTCHWVERHVIRHHGISESGTLMEIDTFGWNSLGTDACDFDPAKIDSRLQN